MLDDVAEVRAALEPLDQSAGHTQTADVLAEARPQREQALVEAGNLAGLAIRELLEVQLHDQHGAMQIDVRTVKEANRSDDHGEDPRSTYSGDDAQPGAFRDIRAGAELAAASTSLA